MDAYLPITQYRKWSGAKQRDITKIVDLAKKLGRKQDDIFRAALRQQIPVDEFIIDLEQQLPIVPSKGQLVIVAAGKTGSDLKKVGIGTWKVSRRVIIGIGNLTARLPRHQLSGKVGKPILQSIGGTVKVINVDSKNVRSVPTEVPTVVETKPAEVPIAATAPTIRKPLYVDGMPAEMVGQSTQPGPAVEPVKADTVQAAHPVQVTATTRRSPNPALKRQNVQPSVSTEKPATPAEKVEPQQVRTDNDEVIEVPDQPVNTSGGSCEKPPSVGERLAGGISSLGDLFMDNLMWFGIGAGVLILIILAFVFLPKIHPNAGASPTAQAAQAAQVTQPTQIATKPTIQASPQVVQKPPVVPTLTPIDLAHVAWLTLLQYTIVAFTILVIIGIPSDEWRRSKSLLDTFWVTVAIALIMGYAIIAKLAIGWWGPGTPRNFSIANVNWIMSGLCLVGGIIAVVVATTEGGFDLTPLAGFLTVLGGATMIFGHVGALQEFYGIADGPILPLSQTSVLLTLKMTSQVSMSMLTYTLLGLGTIFYLVELVRTVFGLDGNVYEKILYSGSCFVGLIAYFTLKNWLLSVGVPAGFVIVIIVAIGIIAAIAHEQFGKSNIDVGVGERRFRDALVPPYDKIAFQITLGLLLIAMTGRIL